MEELNNLTKSLRDQNFYRLSSDDYWKDTFNPLLSKLEEKIKKLEEDRKWRREMENEAMKALLNFKR